MSLTQRLRRTSGCKRFMMNHYNLMTCMGWKWSWNVNLEKFSKAKKCWRRTGRGAPPFSRVLLILIVPGVLQKSSLNTCLPHLETVMEGKGNKHQTTTKRIPFFSADHSFVCFVCFTSRRTEPSSTVTAAKYYSYYSHNLFLSYWSPFLKALSVFYFKSLRIYGFH